MPKLKYYASAALVVFCLAVFAEGPRAEEPAPQTEIFTGTVMVTNAPKTGIARFRVTVERWTTDEERKVLVEAIRSGTDALVAAMEKMTAGYIQFENNLRWPIRSAASWTTDKGRFVRFATNRPINFNESYNQTRTMDYPIGVIELLLPPEGEGQGSLLVATEVQIGADGRLEVKSLPSNTGPQAVSNVASEFAKPKKSKKK